MIPIAMALAQFAPQIIGLLAGPKAGDIADKVVGIAQAATGTASPDAALKAIQADPSKALEFQRVIAEKEIELAKIDADVMKAQFGAAADAAKAVNQTMQAEAGAEHWPTYSWRPFIGFAFGALGMVAGVTAAVAYIGVMFFGVDSSVLAQLPGLLGAEAAIMATMAPVLGIASYFRGKMQADPTVPTVNRG